MANILFTLIEVLGIHKHVISWVWVHRLRSPFEKSIIERTIQYFKDKTEGFDDYYPCLGGNNCDLLHVHNWIQFIHIDIQFYYSHQSWIYTDSGEVVSKVNRPEMSSLKYLLSTNLIMFQDLN